MRRSRLAQRARSSGGAARTCLPLAASLNPEDLCLDGLRGFGRSPPTSLPVQVSESQADVARERDWGAEKGSRWQGASFTTATQPLKSEREPEHFLSTLSKVLCETEREKRGEEPFSFIAMVLNSLRRCTTATPGDSYTLGAELAMGVAREPSFQH